MIRPITILMLAAAAGTGLNLYSVKRDAQLEEQSTVRITHEAKEVRAHAALLHAEYDLLSDPDRLRDLAGQVLTLQPTDPKQYVSLADLTKRLPAVAPLPAPPEAPKVEAPAVEVMAQAAAPMVEKPVEKPAEKIAEKAVEKPVEFKPAATLADAKPAAPAAPAPIKVAAAQPMPHPVAAKPALAPAPSLMAESKPQPSTPPVRAVVPQHPTPVVAQARAAYQPPPYQTPAYQTPAYQAPAYQAPAYHAPAYQPPPFIGSALGMARQRPQPATQARFISSDSGADR